MKALGDEALKREKKKYQVLYSHCVYCVERERERQRKSDTMFFVHFVFNSGLSLQDEKLGETQEH